MDAVDKLLAIEEIKQVKARYFRTMDTKDWDAYAEVFAPDAVMDMRSEMRDGVTEGEGVTTGNRAIAEFVKGSIDVVTTVHHGHMPEITFTSDTTANVIWAMEDKLRWPDGYPIKTMHGYGHYHETYRCIDGAWKIQTIRLTRLRVDAA
jgi:SnoaL-like domain